MKRILVLLTIMAAGLFISCEAGEDEAPAAGTGTVTVQVTYTGVDATTCSKPGSGNIFVYLIPSDEISNQAPEDPAYFAYAAATENGAVTISNSYNVSITNVPAGEYYVLIFYDFQLQTKHAGTGDYYVLYNNYSGNVDKTTNCTAAADLITVTENTITALPNISFANSTTYQLYKRTDIASSGVGGCYYYLSCTE